MALRSLLFPIMLVACSSSPPVPAAPAEPRPVRVPEPSPEPPEPEPEPEPEPLAIEDFDDVAQWLAEDHLRSDETGRQMELRRHRTVRWWPEGPDLGEGDGQPGSWEPVAVLDVTDDRLRIIVDERDVRLMAYVDREDARPVLQESTPLRPAPDWTPKDPPERGYVVIERGTWVEVLRQDGDASEVQLVRGKRTFEGWVDTTLLGITITKGPKRPPVDATRFFRAKRNTKVLDRPGGTVLSDVDEKDSLIALTDTATKGHRLVEYSSPCDTELTFVGFVRRRDLHQPDFGMGYGCGFGGSWPQPWWGSADGAPRVTVAAGRFLLAPDRPMVVGCISKDSELARISDELFAVPTRWGPLPVRLAPPDLVGTCGK